MKKGRVNAKYEEKYIKANRKFPVAYTVVLPILLLIQVVLLIVGFAWQPKPQDLIRQYHITVDPLEDGSLDITYHLIWEALDTSEELTWVEIGMANENYSVYPDSVSSNIASYNKYADEDYIALELYFEKAYTGGDVIDFTFQVNQRDMLCKNEKGYFYEFVPGWFNSIRVEDYQITWLMDGSKNYVYQGTLDYGEYRKTTIQYGAHDFDGCRTVKYIPFDDENAYNELESDKFAITFLCCLFAAGLIIPEVYIIDCYVSYTRGRGFLTGYGYHVHTYGRSNPYYIRERDKYNATHSRGSGGRGGSCACACACACAGGGRAGCSQKDTYDTKQSKDP